MDPVSAHIQHTNCGIVWQNAIPRELGTIKVGNDVEILSKRPLHQVPEFAVLKPDSS